ncbi:Hcp family type VI secretion system effector [Azospirillum sp. ST 5-10]|uniref:Hcp family type VI secretion system effector n=1 Tax=unclassified Azospirillum TaxID=2630922 RepID=UPI003F4A2B61
MALNAYLAITGAKQGNITKGASTADSIGNSYQEGHEDQSMIFAFNTNMTVPRDPQSGQPTGARVHEPVRITKQVDKASPLLCQALASGETLSDITLEVFRTSATGQIEKFYTVKWTDAILVRHSYATELTLNAETSALPNLEVIEFTYRKVEWTHEKAGTSGSDDWRSPAK